MPAQKKKKIWKWLIICIAVIALIVIIGNVVIKGVIKNKFDNAINQLQPYADAKYKDIHINLLTGSFAVDSLTVQYHPSAKQPQNQHSIYLPSVSLNGLNYFKIAGGKTFTTSALNIDHSTIILNTALLEEKDTTLKKLIAKLNIPFQHIELNKLALSNITVKKTSGEKYLSFFDGDIIVKDINADRADSAFSKDSIQFSSLECTLNNITYPLHGYHSVRINKLILNSSDSLLKIDSLKIIPQRDKYELGRKLGHQADHVNAVVPTITLTGLHVKDLLKKKLIADEFTIDNSIVYVFRDRRLPRLMKEQPTPLEYLKQIPFDVFIKQFKLNDATITSEEFPKEGNKSGYIKITGINIGMHPFFNNAYKGHTTLTASVKGNIMSAGLIHANIDLSLLTGIQNIKGAIEELHLTAMNPSSENLGKFHIESGILDQLNFSFSAGSKKASGEIIGVYHDLVVERLKVKDGELKKAAVPTLALKAIIIPKNKPASMSVKRRTGKIDFDRDPTRLITFFYLKALLDGIRNSFSLGFLLPQ